MVYFVHVVDNVNGGAVVTNESVQLFCAPGAGGPSPHPKETTSPPWSPRAQNVNLVAAPGTA
jgi:hypothetical protein